MVGFVDSSLVHTAADASFGFWSGRPRALRGRYVSHQCRVGSHSDEGTVRNVCAVLLHLYVSCWVAQCRRARAVHGLRLWEISRSLRTLLASDDAQQSSRGLSAVRRSPPGMPALLVGRTFAQLPGSARSGA